MNDEVVIHDLNYDRADFIVIEPGYLYRLTYPKIHWLQDELRKREADLIYVDTRLPVCLSKQIESCLDLVIVNKNWDLFILEDLVDLREKMVVYYPQQADFQNIIDLQSLLNGTNFYAGGDIKELHYFANVEISLFHVTLDTENG